MAGEISIVSNLYVKHDPKWIEICIGKLPNLGALGGNKRIDRRSSNAEVQGEKGDIKMAVISHLNEVYTNKKISFRPFNNLSQADIKIDFYADDNRPRDLDNMIHACKPWIDGLVHSGVISSDSWKVVPQLSAQYHSHQLCNGGGGCQYCTSYRLGDTTCLTTIGNQTIIYLIERR